MKQDKTGAPAREVNFGIYQHYNFEKCFDQKFRQNMMYYVHHFSVGKYILEPEIAELVVAMNIAGINTTGSCHGHHPDEPRFLEHDCRQYSLPCVTFMKSSNHSIIENTLVKLGFRWKIADFFYINLDSSQNESKKAVINPGNAVSSLVLHPDVETFTIEDLIRFRGESRKIAEEIYMKKK